ncbi:hypothetical protein [Bacillus licheniformis]|uniref:hypothetical protein n=1 Tax=Bacillus licheniformis TaxID=1402 RepID=UPI0031F4E659
MNDLKEMVKDLKGTARYIKVMSRRKRKTIQKAGRAVLYIIGAATILEMFV